MNLKTFKKQLSATKNTSEANNLLQSYLNRHEITTFAFTYYAYHPKSANKIKYDFASENLMNWHKYFIEQNYDYIDTTLDEVYQTTLPVFWDFEQQLNEAKTQSEKEMRFAAAKFGAEIGLSIPLHGPDHDFAILMVEQLKGETCLKKWPELQDELFLVAHHYYHQLKKLLLENQPQLDKYQLTQREIQLLTLLARNFNLTQIAKTLHITERTVNYHIQKINKKFGVKNKYQSVAKALDERLLNP